ncbi:MAG: lamin tail domain-containing protein [Anaerolineaceae bacterium]|nr:lamin tail domain-containing protein [Anaerolineaceae bacterium]
MKLGENIYSTWIFGRIYFKKNKQTTWIAAIFGLISICLCGQLLSDQTSKPAITNAVVDSPVPQEVTATAIYQDSQTPLSPTATETIELPTLFQPSCIPEQQPVQALVTYVVDGDTIKVDISGIEYTVRLIGINTPEITHDSQVAEYFGNEATQKTKEIVTGKQVWLYKDVSETDQYGRLLRYVVLDGDLFLNEILVSDGFAYAVTYPPDVSCAELFVEAQECAVQNTTGLWAQEQDVQAESEQSITIASIFYDGSAGTEEPDEYVSIVNQGSEPVQLKGWVLKDESGKTFFFPDMQMESGQTCRIFTNEDHPESCGLNWHFTGSAIWNNSGDTATLYNSQKEIVSQYSY